MAKTIVLGGDKGGSGKTTSSHAIAHGLAMYGIKAFHISTDPRREILPLRQGAMPPSMVVTLGPWGLFSTGWQRSKEQLH